LKLTHSEPLLAVLLLVVLFLPSLVGATIFSCAQSDGSVMYTDVPLPNCQAINEKEKTINTFPSASEPTAPYRTPEELTSSDGLPSKGTKTSKEKRVQKQGSNTEELQRMRRDDEEKVTLLLTNIFEWWELARFDLIYSKLTDASQHSYAQHRIARLLSMAVVKPDCCRPLKDALVEKYEPSSITIKATIQVLDPRPRLPADRVRLQSLRFHFLKEQDEWHLPIQDLIRWR
jgi:hypothetical protein